MNITNLNVISKQRKSVEFDCIQDEENVDLFWFKIPQKQNYSITINDDTESYINMELKHYQDLPEGNSLNGYHMDIEVHNNFEEIGNYEKEALSRNVATRFDEFVFNVGPLLKKEVQINM